MTGRSKESFSLWQYIILVLLTFVTTILCVAAGSVSIPIKDVLIAIGDSVCGLPLPENITAPIIISVRLPRVLSAALVGAALSLCGGAMQGLLRNPLADGSTLGVSAGASVGAVASIAFGIAIPGAAFGSTMIMAIAFAFASMMLILGLAYKLDYSLSTNTIILIGVIFAMFANSITSLMVTFAGSKAKSILFWTMGSLVGNNYAKVLLLLAALLICGIVILRYCRELNAFAIGEENARHIGVDVKRIKLILLIAVSVLIGVCVSVSGTIGFVGLVIPHIMRLIFGPNHKKLLPATIFGGAIFLMLADLVSRTILDPMELPIGVVTSFIGSIVFVCIFYRNRKAK